MPMPIGLSAKLKLLWLISRIAKWVYNWSIDQAIELQWIEYNERMHGKALAVHQEARKLGMHICVVSASEVFPEDIQGLSQFHDEEEG